jgi:hypothetical protein
MRLLGKLKAYEKPFMMLLFFVMCGIFLLTARFEPGVIHERTQPDTGLWYAINSHLDHGLTLGKDIFFSPFTYIQVPLAVHGHLEVHVLFLFFLRLCVLGGVCLFVKRTGRFWEGCLILFAFLYSTNSGLQYHILVYAVGILWFVEDMFRGKHCLFFILPAVLAAFFVYVKLNLAVCLAGMFVIYLIFDRIIKNTPLFLTALKASVYPITFIIAGLLIYKSPMNALENLKISWAFARGRSASVAIVGPEAEFALGILLCLFLIPVIFWICKSSGLKKGLFAAMILLIPTYMCYRHAFMVQRFFYTQFFFAFSPVVMTLGLLFMPLRKIFVLIIATFFLTYWGSTLNSPKQRELNPIRTILDINTDSLRTVLNLNDAVKKAKAENDRIFALHALSDDEIKTIGSHTVEIVPLDTHKIAATGLRWHPTPILHPLRYVYQSEADAKTASIIEEGRGAEYIVLSWQDIQYRHPILSSPQTYRAILNHYSFISQTDDRLLLKKTGHKNFKKRYLGSAAGKWGETVELPDHQGMLIAELELRYTFLGKFMRTFFWTQPTVMHFIRNEFRSGHRFRTGLADGGFFVSYVPMGLAHVRSLIETYAIHPEVEKSSGFEISQTGSPLLFKKDFTIRYYDWGSGVSAVSEVSVDSSLDSSEST